MSSTKISVQWEDKNITIEGPEDFVNAQVRFFVAHSSKQISSNVDIESVAPLAAADLISEKGPKGHHEIVAVLAFFLSEQGTPEFAEGDIQRLYRQAHIRPPKVLAQALRDAKNRFDYLEAASKRGFYRLSAHGDRTVRFDMPRSAS